MHNANTDKAKINVIIPFILISVAAVLVPGRIVFLLILFLTHYLNMDAFMVPELKTFGSIMTLIRDGFPELRARSRACRI